MPPDGGVEKVGVELVAEKVTAFLRDMQKAEGAYDSFTLTISKGAPAAAKATEGLGIASVAAGAGVAVLAMGALSAAQAIGQTLVGALKSATAAVTEFLGEGLQLAGQFQEQEFAALAIGRAMGLQEKEIRDAIDTLNDANIRYDVAAKVTSQLIRNQIDLAKAFDLARVAQATGVIVGEDSSETLQRLVWAATTHNTVMLRKMGIMVDLTAAEERYAVSIGKTVDALTQQEKTQSAVDAVIAASANLMDVYAAAMESPTKALRSLSQRVIPELKASLMQVFLPAWLTVIKAVMGLADAFQEAISEGGALYPILIRLGAIASILADAFSAALQVAINFVTGLQADLGGGLADIAASAFSWGANIVASLAEGIINAAQTVLVMAMNFVGSILSWFMGPGSPPRIAPDLPAWGASAMEEYLRGFTEADFGILKGLQSLLRQALTGPEFAAISQEIARALTEGADESFFERLAAAAGEYGEQIAELARLQFDLAAATNAVNAANKKYERSQAKVSSLTAEYNDLLREGADKEILDAKLAQIRAAEDERDAAAEDAAAAETNIEALKEQADLQAKLVKQLLAMAKAARQAVSAGGGGAGAGVGGRAGGVGMPRMEMPPLPEPSEFDIGSRIATAIDDAKAVMLAKLQELFQPILDVWKDTGQPALDTIGEMFLELKEKADEFLAPIEEWFVEHVAPAMAEVQKFVDEHLSPTLSEFWDIVKTDVLPILQDLIDIALIPLKLALDEIWKVFEEHVIPLLEISFIAALTVVGRDLDILRGKFDSWRATLQKIHEWLLKVKEALLAPRPDTYPLYDPFLPDSPPPLAKGFAEVGAAMRKFAAVDIPMFKQAMSSIAPTPVSPMMQSSQITYSTPVSVGPNYISGGLDAAAVEALAVRAVEKALRRTV